LATPSPENAVDILLAVDSAPAGHSSQEFANVGSGRNAGQVKANFAAGSLVSHESPTAVSRLLNGQHTFTHHLYHHYDIEPSLLQRPDATRGIFCWFLVTNSTC